MTLIRFLSSGSRGLTKGAPPMGRYRLPEGRLIPDFGGAKNPFVSKTLPSQLRSSSAADVTARAASTQAAPPSPVPLRPAPRERVQRVLTQTWVLMRGLWSRVKPLSLQLLQWAKRMSTAIIGSIVRRTRLTSLAGSVLPQRPGPVQGELSLENVRVVRNDLTDTDYEVVRSDTSTASPIRRVPETVSVPAEPTPLGQLAERLFSQKTR